jgi:hypothetical protein
MGAATHHNDPGTHYTETYQEGITPVRKPHNTKTSSCAQAGVMGGKWERSLGKERERQLPNVSK